jgi:hypothetical protein
LELLLELEEEELEELLELELSLDDEEDSEEELLELDDEDATPTVQ